MDVRISFFLLCPSAVSHFCALCRFGFLMAMWSATMVGTWHWLSSLSWCCCCFCYSFLPSLPLPSVIKSHARSRHTVLIFSFTINENSLYHVFSFLSWLSTCLVSYPQSKDGKVLYGTHRRYSVEVSVVASSRTGLAIHLYYHCHSCAWLSGDTNS